MLAASTNFIKVVWKAYELPKVVGEFCKLLKDVGKLNKLHKVIYNFINFMRCCPTSTNIAKLFAASTNFLEDWFYPR